ncbi:hypothetical protein AM593_03501, partial [Mytilus galloprovincialis]
NIRIYGVQCGYYGSTKDFYNKITQATDGKCLKLADFANMFDFMMAICYREHDETLLQNYETEVRARGTTINKDLEALFGKLRRADTEIMDTSTSVPPALTKIPSLTKPPSVKILKPSVKITVKPIRQPRTTRFTSKHQRLMDRRNQERLDKYKLKNLPKLRRENVPETNFMLNDAPWSKWQLAVTPALPEGTESNLWEKRRGDLTGFRRKEICDGQYQKPALYEFAVQTAEHCKRYVVYCKCNKGFMLDKGSWESRLLNTSDVRTEVEDVLKKGFRLFYPHLIHTASRIGSFTITLKLGFSSNLPTAPAYRIYISQLMRYSRTCSNYSDCKTLQVSEQTVDKPGFSEKLNVKGRENRGTMPSNR